MTGSHEVRGSNPLISTKNHRGHPAPFSLPIYFAGKLRIKGPRKRAGNGAKARSKGASRKDREVGRRGATIEPKRLSRPAI